MDTSVAHGCADATGSLPSPAEIRVQLTRIVSSPEFPRTGRGAAFLAYVVEEALAEEVSRLAFRMASSPL